MASAQGVLAGIRSLRAGAYDHDVGRRDRTYIPRAWASAPTFRCHIMSGPNAFQKLGQLWADYSSSRSSATRGRLRFLDVGAEVGYYLADIGRTAPVGGRFSPDQRKVYNLYLPCYLAALRSIRPGVSQRDLVKTCVDAMERQLPDIAEDYLRVAASGFVEMTKMRASLGHYLDMNVIGAGAAPDEPLQPGMVFAYRAFLFCNANQFAVFIEDNVLVTDNRL